tara:strand:+ start:487 stop:777 length:291 start_codon:yes stop_codon:yes gene_type:complete
MAAGDVVSGISTTNSIDFQPASGVECMISCINGSDANYLYLKITDGVTVSTSRFTNNNSFIANNGANIKVFINNTNYLNVTAGAGYPVSYTGVQTK